MLSSSSRIARRRHWLIAALLLLVQCELLNAKERLASVRDAIEMWKVGDSAYASRDTEDGRVAKFAPDGKQFVVVLRRGDLETNTNRYVMLLWDKDLALRGTGEPKVLLELSSSSVLDGIDSSSIVWLPDNQTLLFLGERRGELHKVFRLNTRTGVLMESASHPTNIRSFSWSEPIERLAYVAERSYTSLWNDEVRRAGLVVSREYLPDLLTGRDGYRFRGASDEFELFVQRGTGVQELKTARPIARGAIPWLSPDGGYVVIATNVPKDNVPGSWGRYEDELLVHLFSYDRSQGHGHSQESSLQSYELLNTRTGQSKILIDAPIWLPLRVVWLQNGRSVILNGVFLPLDNIDPAERRAREMRPHVVEVELESGRLTRIGDQCSQAVRWDADRNELICLSRSGQSASGKTAQMPSTVHTSRFIRNGSEWRERVSRDSTFQGRPEVFVEESMNDRPRIVIRSRGQEAARLIKDLNPQFDHIRLGRVEEVSWDWRKGERISGGLYLPPSYQPGRRYPLVIQTHEWNPARFWFDGPWTTSYAAQPLAARDIVVLQLQDQEALQAYGTRQEVERALAIYRSAIAYLSERGIVDTEKVGILGFSHTCFHVKYALVHAPDLFAAASVAEGEDGGYLQFITGMNSYVDERSMYGGAPFGKHLSDWALRSPGFGLDRVQAPLWINVLNPRFLLMEWEWFEGLRLLGKPVEMVMLEGDSHVLQKPQDRLISQGGNVDWFDFWLNGREDSDSSKASQYVRWRALRNSAVKYPASMSSLNVN